MDIVDDDATEGSGGCRIVPLGTVCTRGAIYEVQSPHPLIICMEREVGLGELCSKTVLLCYAPMLSIMLLRIVVMLTLCCL